VTPVGLGSAVERLPARAGSGRATCCNRWLCQLTDERRISDLSNNDATLIGPQAYFESPTRRTGGPAAMRVPLFIENGWPSAAAGLLIGRIRLVIPDGRHADLGVERRWLRRRA
jgi:hypothetical protein